MEQLGERLYEIRKELRITQRQAAAKIDVTQQTWQSAEKGKTVLSSNRLKRVAEEFGINLVWLISGKGSKTGETPELVNIQKRKLVKLISGKVLAGLASGYEPEKEEVIDTIYFPGIQSNTNCYAIQVEGTSMEPSIKKGGAIIVERMHDRTDFVNGKPYVIIIEGIPFVKNVSMVLTGEDKGKFLIHSTNEVNTQTVTAEDIHRWYKVIYVLNPV